MAGWLLANFKAQQTSSEAYGSQLIVFTIRHGLGSLLIPTSRATSDSLNNPIFICRAVCYVNCTALHHAHARPVETERLSSATPDDCAGGSWNHTTGVQGTLPCEPSAWCKMKQGWVEVVEVASDVPYLEVMRRGRRGRDLGGRLFLTPAAPRGIGVAGTQWQRGRTG